MLPPGPAPRAHTHLPAASHGLAAVSSPPPGPGGAATHRQLWVDLDFEGLLLECLQGDGQHVRWFHRNFCLLLGVFVFVCVRVCVTQLSVRLSGLLTHAICW